MELNLRPTLKQYQVYKALANPAIDFVFFGGGAGGAKSWVVCESRLVNCLRYPGYKSYIGREELKRLMQSTYVTWTKVCQYHKIPPEMWKLNGQYNYILFDNGSRIDLLDLKYLPGDPMYERFGSLEYTDGAIDEAGEVDFMAHDVLKSRVGRHMNDEFGLHPSTLITGNPKKNWTYHTFYKPNKKGELPANRVFIQSLYGDNPYTAESYGKQLSLITDKATKERLMLGNWEYDDDPSVMMDYDAITDIWSNTVDYSEHKFLTADIARFGQDKTVIYCWKGFEAYKTITLNKSSIDNTAIRIRDLLRSEKIPYSCAIADEDGVGGGVVDILKIKGFVNNSSPLDNPKTFQKENYQNLKTQCYYMLADKVNKREIAVRCDDAAERERTEEELEQIKTKDADKDGVLKIVPKEEVKELIGRSPDNSDGIMMRMWFELKQSGKMKAKQHIPQGLARSLHSFSE